MFLVMGRTKEERESEGRKRREKGQLKGAHFSALIGFDNFMCNSRLFVSVLH